jgi:hypothetical protein
MDRAMPASAGEREGFKGNLQSLDAESDST